MKKKREITIASAFLLYYSDTSPINMAHLLQASKTRANCREIEEK